MSIELDWELESNDGIEQVGEDPVVIATRERRMRRLRKIIPIVGVLAGISLLFAGVRLWKADQQTHTDLEATIAAETLALRMGDRDAFMAIQIPDDYWRTIQSKAFADYQKQVGGHTSIGKIASLDVSADHARAVLTETYRGEDYEVIWFYVHDVKGWKHIPSQANFFGAEQQISTPHADIRYSSIDEAAAQELAVAIEQWWASLERVVPCNLTACSQTPERLAVRISTDFVETNKPVSNSTKDMIVRSPHLSRYPTSGAVLDASTRAQAARWMAKHWVAYLGGQSGEIKTDFDWLEEELTRWVVHQIEPGSPIAPLLTPLGEQFGSQAVHEFARRFRQDGRISDALQAATGTDVEMLPLDWSLYLENHLIRETRLRFHGQSLAGSGLTDETNQGVNNPLEYRAVKYAEPASIRVERTYWLNGLLWAEVHFHPRGWVAKTVDEMVTYEPFRPVGGELLHTTLDYGDTGGSNTDHGPHFVVHYDDINQEAAAGALQFLENKYNQFRSDLGLEAEPVTLNVSLTNEGVAGPESTTVVVPSMISIAHSNTVTLQRAARVLICQEVFTRLVISSLSSSNRYFLAEAIANWELSRLGLGDAVVYSPRLAVMSRRIPIEMDSILYPQPIEALNSPIRARALIDYVGEQYGVAGVRQMLATLNEATDLVDWFDRANLVTTPEAP
jgi:hypothetical protein